MQPNEPVSTPAVENSETSASNKVTNNVLTKDPGAELQAHIKVKRRYKNRDLLDHVVDSGNPISRD